MKPSSRDSKQQNWTEEGFFLKSFWHDFLGKDLQPNKDLDEEKIIIKHCAHWSFNSLCLAVFTSFFCTAGKFSAIPGTSGKSELKSVKSRWLLPIG